MSTERQKNVVDEQTGKTVVFSSESREYITSDTGKVPPFRKLILSPRAYGDAISSLVTKACDVLPYDPATGRVLVATRAREPQAGDWLAGGRKLAGESDLQAALRNLECDFGIPVAGMAEGHLEKLDRSYDVIWDSREQPPTLNESGESVTGVHQDATVFALAVSEPEFNPIVVPSKEFSGLRWEDGFDIIESPDGVYHPAFRDIVADTLEQVTRPL